MENLRKKQKGITLIALVITIIVLMILAMISIRQGIISLSSTQDSIIESNLQMVQQKVVEEFTKSSITGEIKEYYGEKLDHDKLKEAKEGYQINLQKESTPESYYIVSSDDLTFLGLEVSDGQRYLLDYETGEVWDITNKTYEDGKTYAYLSGVIDTIKIENEKYTDSPISIILANDIYEEDENYKIELKVNDKFSKLKENQKITLSIDEVSEGNFVVKVGDIVLKPEDIVSIIQSPDQQTNSEDGECIYTITIGKEIIPDQNLTISVIVNPNAIVDVKGEGNEKTVITTKVAQDEISSEIDWKITSLSYETKLDERKNGYTDPDGVKWGTSATIGLELYSQNGLKNQPYCFEYGWSTTGPVFDQKVTFYPKANDKKAEASIYINYGTGKGILYIRPLSNANYTGVNSKVLSSESKTIGVNLDNTPPQITNHVHEDFKTRFFGAYNNKQFDVHYNEGGSRKISHLYSIFENPDAEYLQDTAKYKLIVKDGENIGDESGIYNGDKIIQGMDFSMGISSSDKNEPDWELAVNGVQGDIKKQLDKHRNCIYSNFSTKVFTEKELASGLFYIWYGKLDIGETGEKRILTDNVGNPVSIPHKFGILNSETNELEPYVVDFYRPELYSVSVENNIGKIIITDDYSGLSNKEEVLKNIKYKWVKSRDEVPSKSELTSIDLRKSESKSNEFGSFELIDADRPYSFGNDTIYRTITISVEPPEDNEKYYLYVDASKYTDIAGNPMDENDCTSISEEYLRYPKDLKVLLEFLQKLI